MLAWEPGVGKTYPLLAAASKGKGKTLYLGPPAIRTQVAREAVAYGFFTQDEIQVIGSGRDKLWPDARLIISSYEHAVNPSIWKQLFKEEWDALVLDEAHMLKNQTAKRTKAVYGARSNSAGALYKQAKRIWLATGTPLVNDPSDLWTHVSRCFPEIAESLNISNKYDWMDKFCFTVDTPYGPKVLGGRNLELLKVALKNKVSRIKKTEALDLPPLNITQQWVPPTKIDMSNIPLEALDELMVLLNSTDEEDFDRLATPLATLRRKIGLAKAAHVAEIARTEFYGSESKIIIFYQHTGVMEEIKASLEQSVGMANTVLTYSGGLSTAKRDAIVKSFNEDPKCRILLAQIQAAGTGLNLQCANRVLLAEPAWTPALNDQAISRAYRGGQTQKVWASYICLEKSVDEAVTKALIRKSKIIEGAIG